MTIRTRIDQIEKSQPAGDDEKSLRLLVELVARRDALFFPWRETGDSFVAARQRQRRYLDGSQGLSAKADGKSDWKPSHELRRSLVASGWITAIHSGGQITSVFITEKGDAVCRVAVGDRLQTVREALPMLALLLQLDGRPHCGRDWITESDIAGKPLSGDPSDWEHIAEAVLPFLVRGVVIANCDAHGRVAYSVNRDAVDSLTDEPVVEGVEFHPDAEDWYLTAFGAERDSMRSAEPFDSAEIVLPIPVWG